VAVSHLGQVYRVRTDKGLNCYVTKQTVEEFGLEAGKQVFTAFKATAARVRKSQG